MKLPGPRALLLLLLAVLPTVVCLEDAGVKLEDVVDNVPPPLGILTSPVGADGLLPSETSVDAVEPSSNRSATEWFKLGVDAYLSEHWAGCVRNFENAIVEWNFFRQANIDCRLRCGEEARRVPPLFPDDVDHLQYAEELVRTTLCIMKCKKLAFRGRKTPEGLSTAEQRPFRELKPYEYLQLCYYQVSPPSLKFT